MIKREILNPEALAVRLVEIRKGINIPMGADRIYTCECVAKEYARNHTEIAEAAAQYIADNAEDIIRSMAIHPRGLHSIHADLTKKVGQPYSSGDFPYNKLCEIFGYAP
jgi:hypothetical protein